MSLIRLKYGNKSGKNILLHSRENKFMTEFGSILAVAVILWTALILYMAYTDSKVRDLEKKIKTLQSLVKK